MQFNRKSRRIQSESFNSHVTLNHEAQVDDVMVSDCLANNFGSNATTGCHESIQNVYLNDSMNIKTCAMIPEDELMLESAIEAGASLEALAKGTEKIPNKRKGRTICKQYYRKRRSRQSESFNSHVTLNHEARVDDAMSGDSLANSFGSTATTGCHESIQNDFSDGPMREDGLCKVNENYCFLLTDNLMTFFDTGIEPNDDSHVHNGDSDDSSVVTEVEYASLLSFSSKDYINCVLNTEDTIDNIPDSQLLDSDEDVLEDSSLDGDLLDDCHSEDDSFDGDQQDVCHCEDDEESISISHLDPVHLIEEESICNLNTEDPEIPCNDDIFMLNHSSPSARPQSDTESVDLESSFTQSQMDGPEFDSANPHVDCTLKSVSMDHDLSTSDHNDSSDSDLFCRPQTDTDSVDPTSSFSRSQIDGPDLSSDFESANPHVDCTLESVSMDHNPSSPSDHNSDIDLHGFPDVEDTEIRSASIRLQTALDSIDLTSCFTEDGPDISFEYDYADPQAGCTPKSVSVDHNSSISDHNSHNSSIDPASCFTQSQMDGSDLSCEFGSAHPHVGKYVSVDHDPLILDHNNSDSDSDLPCFPDIDALILKLDFEYAQESWITNEVKRGTYKRYKPSVNRLEQRAMSSLGAFAVFYSHQFNYYIKKAEVTIGRSTDDTEVDIDLRKESHANMISRQQATIKIENDGTFTLKNIGKGLILMNGKSIARGQVAALGSSCLLQIREMDFMFKINDRHVRWYMDNIVKKTQGKFTTFEWSVN